MDSSHQFQSSEGSSDDSAGDIFESSSSSEAVVVPQMDGPIDLETHKRRKRLGGDVCAVFVHAGAGFHSVLNERIHLAACEE